MMAFALPRLGMPCAGRAAAGQQSAHTTPPRFTSTSHARGSRYVARGSGGSSPQAPVPRLHGALQLQRSGRQCNQACHSVAACGAASAPPPQPADVFDALRRCRAIFSCMAFCAVYAFLSWGTAAGAPFAHVASLAVGETGTAGLTNAAKSAWAGLAAGFLHTLCGPDHLAALTPLTIGRNRFAASALGALWGFGHSTGQLILGLVFVVLKDRFHDFVPFLDKWAGTVVALTLLAIGFMGVYESVFEKDHGHAEEEQESMKLALAGGGSVSAGKATSVRAGFATYATGIVYGLQPDALFVVIPALALPTKLAAIAYCTMFVIGTVTAMGGYTLLIGTTSQALIKEQPWVQKHLSTIASCIAIMVGLAMLLAGFGFEVPFFS